MYTRQLFASLNQKIGSGKAIIITGPRQVGKTTLIHQLLKDTSFLFLNGDDPSIRNLLNSATTGQLKSIIGNYKMVFIDEAQRINNIGITLKLITDQFKDVQLFVSGSSAFELSGRENEALTGRKWEYRLFPISWKEFEAHHGFLYAQQQLENCLRFGFYPDVLNHKGEEELVLKNLVNSYLYRDLLAQANIRRPEILDKLVTALALQIGNEVNYTELAQTIGTDKNTVIRYIDILEKGFVVFRLSSFSRNLRNEIKTNRKIYFYDVGVRNMIIGNFNPIGQRNDLVAIWENFLISERLKQIEYNQLLTKSYFWRSKQQQEVDYVESESGIIRAFELKWTKKNKHKIPKTFLDEYQAQGQIIDNENFREFIG